MALGWSLARQRPGRNARLKSTFTWRIATLYGHHTMRLNRYSARMSGEV